MGEFNSNKNDRLVQKRRELMDEEREAQSMKHIVERKEKLIEDAMNRLQLLKKENENIKIDEIIVKFFKKRDQEEQMLNKLDMITSLHFLMLERKETNDFAFENDIKSVQVFKDLNQAYTQSVRFKDKL